MKENETPCFSLRVCPRSQVTRFRCFTSHTKRLTYLSRLVNIVGCTYTDLNSIGSGIARIFAWVMPNQKFHMRTGKIHLTIW